MEYKYEVCIGFFGPYVHVILSVDVVPRRSLISSICEVIYNYDEWCTQDWHMEIMHYDIFSQSKYMCVT